VIVRHSAREWHPLAQSEGRYPSRDCPEPGGTPRVRFWQASATSEPRRRCRRSPTTRGSRRVHASGRRAGRFAGGEHPPHLSAPQFIGSPLGQGARQAQPPGFVPGRQPLCLRAAGQRSRRRERRRNPRIDSTAAADVANAMASGPEAGAVEKARRDHHEKTTTEDYWTWHLALFPWERHSSGSRCWSGLLGRWRFAAGGTARKVVGRRCFERLQVRRQLGFRPDVRIASKRRWDMHLGAACEGFDSPRVRTRTDTVASEQAFEGRSPREHRVVALLQGR